jgi:hypothetical protein
MKQHLYTLQTTAPAEAKVASEVEKSATQESHLNSLSKPVQKEASAARLPVVA